MQKIVMQRQNFPSAQYYNSDLSIWLSVDPLSDKYPNLSPYTYCADNPVRLVVHGSVHGKIWGAIIISFLENGMP